MSGPLTRIAMVVKAVVAGGVLVALFVGPPLVLTALGGPPWTPARRAFEVTDLVDAWMGFYQLLLLMAWAWWGLLVLQIVAAVRGVRKELKAAKAESASVGGAGSLRGRWMRNLIAGLVLAPLSAPLPAMASASGATVALAPVDPTAGSIADTSTVQVRERQAVATHQEVRVQAWGPSATLWGLAEEHLGEGTRWREIWALNEGRQQSDGSIMHSPGLLVPGWTVLVPKSDSSQAAAAGLQEAKPNSPLRYSIEEGDRLGDIAVRFLGEFDEHRRLQQLNPDRISDPDHIEAGDTIILPVEARDRGKDDHAHGDVRTLDPRTPAADETTDPPQPPPNQPEESTSPPAASPQPSTPSIPVYVPNDDGRDAVPSWAVPAATAVAAGLLALQVGRRRRWYAEAGDSSASEAEVPDVDHRSNPYVMPDKEWPEDEEAYEADGLEIRVPDPGYSDAAIHQARLLIQQSTARLQQRTRALQSNAPVAKGTDTEDYTLAAATGESVVGASRGHGPDTNFSAAENDPPPQLSPSPSPAATTHANARQIALQDLDELKEETPESVTEPSEGELVIIAPPEPQPPKINGSRWNVGTPTPTAEAGISLRALATTVEQSVSRDGTVRVKLFGDPAVLDQHGNRVHGLRRHATQLLIYLVMNPAGAEISVLRELFWPEISLSKATGRLSTEVASLRRTVRTALGDSENLAINAVTNLNGVYQLADFIETDVEAFEGALKAALQQPQEAAERELLLRRAVELHAGRLADRPNIKDAWLQPHRRRLNRAGTHARILLVELIHDRDPDQARILLREAGRLDPTDREIQAKVAQAQARHGL